MSERSRDGTTYESPECPTTTPREPSHSAPKTPHETSRRRSFDAFDASSSAPKTSKINMPKKIQRRIQDIAFYLGSSCFFVANTESMLPVCSFSSIPEAGLPA